MPDDMYSGWRKASRSGSTGGNCVEVGFAADDRAIRDTKEAGDLDRGTVQVSGAAFAAFLHAVKSGSFDR